MAKKVVKKSETSSDRALVSYVLGIFSIVQAFFLPLSAVVFGIIGWRMSYKVDSVFSKKARLLNIIGFSLGLLFTILQIVLAALGITQKLTGAI